MSSTSVSTIAVQDRRAAMPSRPRAVPPPGGARAHSGGGGILSRACQVSPNDSLLLHRARLLEPASRALVEAILGAEIPLIQAARLAGVNASTISRRLATLRRRMADPVVITILESADRIAATDRRIALDHLLYGRPVRLIAAEHNLSLREVRSIIAYARGWARGRAELLKAVRFARDGA